MKDDILNTNFFILVLAILCVLDASLEFGFSYADPVTFIFLLVLAALSLHKKESWAYPIVGMMTSFSFSIPMLMALYHGEINNVAIVVDSVISLFFLFYFGNRLYKKYLDGKKDNI